MLKIVQNKYFLLLVLVQNFLVIIFVASKKSFSIIKVYVRKLFKLKNDGKKEYLCLLSICTANLNRINNMNYIQTLFKVFSIDNRLSPDEFVEVGRE